MRDTYLQWRKEMLNKLGGLPAPEIRNAEWLYLLKNETRNSVMVEGIFVDEQELEEIIGRGNYEIRNAADVLNYFRTAKFLYGLGFENHLNREFTLSMGLVRQINKGILEGRQREPGKIRTGKVKIGGADIQPPEFDIEGWLKLYIKFVTGNIAKLPLLRLQALQHDLFEMIHPFEDGNGRVGRILTNYLFVSLGFPIITIKGDDQSKEKYYQALQESDRGFKDVFAYGPDDEQLARAIDNIQTGQMEEIFFKGLRESMDRLIVKMVEEKGEKVIPTEELAPILGFARESIRKLVERGKLIAVKRGKSHFSHPSLLYQ